MVRFPADATELDASDDEASTPLPARISEVLTELAGNDPVLLVLDGISVWLVD